MAVVAVAGGAWLLRGDEPGGDGAANETGESGVGPVPDEAGAVTPATTGVRVGRVHDGDSFAARVDGGGDVDVRLLGINAPEVGECLHHDARRALVELLTGGLGPVTLERDVTDHDRYGRLLRYARTADGRLVNRLLVERGLALAVPSDPDAAHAAELRDAQADARAGPEGLWRPDACGPPAATGVRVGSVDARAEQVVVRNTGAAPVDLGGWKLRDDTTGNRYRFPAGFTLAAGAAVTVVTGPGADTATTLHWGRPGPVWNDAGDTALLLDPTGNVVSYADT